MRRETLLAWLLVGCAHGEPPCSQPTATAPRRLVSACATPQSAAVAPSTTASPPGSSTTPQPTPSAAPPSLANAEPKGPALDPEAALLALASPQLVDAQGQPLPPTDERPAASSPSLQARVELLCRALVSNNSEQAKAAFFPVIAYQQVKAVAKPERDWKFRLLANFARDIAKYHRRVTQHDPARARCELSIPLDQSRFMKPGSEGNRLAYHRVLRAKLLVKEPGRPDVPFVVTSLISWRGEWYIVHLDGFE